MKKRVMVILLIAAIFMVGGVIYYYYNHSFSSESPKTYVEARDSYFKNMAKLDKETIQHIQKINNEEKLYELYRKTEDLAKKTYIVEQLAQLQTAKSIDVLSQIFESLSSDDTQELILTNIFIREVSDETASDLEKDFYERGIRNSINQSDTIKLSLLMFGIIRMEPTNKHINFVKRLAKNEDPRINFPPRIYLLGFDHRISNGNIQNIKQLRDSYTQSELEEIEYYRHFFYGVRKTSGRRKKRDMSNQKLMKKIKEFFDEE